MKNPASVPAVLLFLLAGCVTTHGTYDRSKESLRAFPAEGGRVCYDNGQHAHHVPRLGSSAYNAWVRHRDGSVHFVTEVKHAVGADGHSVLRFPYEAYGTAEIRINPKTGTVTSNGIYMAAGAQICPK